MSALEDQRLTVAEVAKELRMSPRKVRDLIDREELVAYKISKRKTLVSRSDLDAFIESRRTAPATGGRR